MAEGAAPGALAGAIGAGARGPGCAEAAGGAHAVAASNSAPEGAQRILRRAIEGNIGSVLINLGSGQPRKYREPQSARAGSAPNRQKSPRLAEFMALRVFGLTGGIGSGKSTVGKRFAERGLPVLDADQLARDAVAPGTPGLAGIVERFGPEMLLPNGTLDRKAVAARVFDDAEARRDLNAITHPRVAALFAAKTGALDAAGAPLACYEVPLLFEVGLERALSPVVVVGVPENLQVERAMRRDGSTENEAKARIAAQLSLEEKVRRADYVIDNTGSLEATRARADEVLDDICARFDIDAGRYPRPGHGGP
jgi:dephospho-CoA kinase